MQKDVIYIDVEDDITAIIGKVKASKHGVVALVPPKRTGTIQSIVNLKLVHRAAEHADKRLVIVSNNAALTALAAAAGIPVAKNLQSKPELAEIPALEVDNDDVIDGEALDPKPKRAKASTDPDDLTDEIIAEEAAMAKKPTSDDDDEEDVAPVAPPTRAAAASGKSKVKIPDFDAFRKKIFLIIAAIVLLVGFLVWALVFAPSARIIVTARTSTVPLNTQVKLGDSLTTSLKEGTVKSVTKTSKKDISTSFTATGKKDVGTKATGNVKIKTDAATILISGLSVPAGTQVQSSSGAVYKTTQAATFAKGDASALSGVTVGVEAVENGAKYNGATGSASTSASGVSSVSFVAATAGGTDKTITVVQQSDIDSVNNASVSASDSEAAKKSLTAQFGSDYIVLESTFKSDTGTVKPSPAVGAEAPDGKGTLSGAVTFTMVGVPKKEIGTFLDAYFAQQIDGKSNQRVFSNGVSAATLTNVQQGDAGMSASITANGKVGPKIDENALKEYAKGKRFGEIQGHIQQINGVDTVDVKFAPFWVQSAPGDIKKIQVEFKVND